MPDFTRDEIKTAVEACLGEDFAAQDDASGATDEIGSRRELLRFSAMTMLQNPDSIFYLASLFRSELQDKVAALVVLLNDARDAVDDTIRRITLPDPVLLATAATALSHVSSALESGKHSPVALQRALSDVAEYSTSLGNQLVSAGSMASTATVAKSIIQTTASSLQSAVTEITTDIDTLVGLTLSTAILTRVFLAVTIYKISELLNEKRNTLSATGLVLESELKELYVFLKTAERILGTQSNYPDPFGARLIGSAQPANTVTEPAQVVEAATITGSESFPFAVTPSNKSFSIEVNGTMEAVTLTESPTARITGLKTENFVIQAAQQASLTGTTTTFNFATNQFWRVYVDGIYLEGTISSGSYTITTLIAALQSNIKHPVEGGIGLWLALTDDGSGHLKMAYDDGSETTGDHRIVVGNYTAANTILGFTDGQDSDVSGPNNVEGQEGNRELKLLVDSMAEQTVDLTTGTRSASQVASDIAGSISGVASGSDGGNVYVESDMLGDGGRIVVSGGDCLSTLGFWLGQSARSNHRGFGEIIAEIENQAAGLRGSTEQQLLSSGICTTVTGVGNEDLIDLPAGEGSKVVANDKLIIRSGTNVGAYEILSVSTDQLTLSRDQIETAGPVSQGYAVVREQLTLTSTKTDALDSSLEPQIATLFGFSTTKVWGSVSDLETNMSTKYVREGDLVIFGNNNYVVDSLFGTRLVVSPLVAMNAGALDCSVASADGAAYTTMQSALEIWKANYDNAYPNYSGFMATINRLLVSPSLPNRTQAKSDLDALLDYFTGVGSLSDILDDFECRILPIINNLLTTLEERGSNRGSDLLRSLDFTSFFDFDANLSYDQYAFEKFAVMLQDYIPVEAVNAAPEEDILEDSAVVGVESLDPDEDLGEPLDTYFEPDDILDI